MKINYQHPAFIYYDPISGEYNEDVNEDGVLHVEAKYEVCHSCEGRGSHFRNDLDENELVDSMREDGDEEGLYCYYHGYFDQVCSECRGQRVVASPVLPEWANELMYLWIKSENEHRAISNAERSVGA